MTLLPPPELDFSRFRGIARAAAWSAALAILLYLVSPLAAQSGSKFAPTKSGGKSSAAAPAGKVKDFHSQHFLVHTDLSAKEAEDLLKRLETMFKLISAYWSRPPSGILECWVVKDLSAWPEEMVNEFEPQGLAKIKEGAGVCIGRTQSLGTQFLNKAKVYACAHDDIPQHESVHGYCNQAFGKTGPKWYAEGMAELGHYWVAGEKGVNAFPVAIKYLRGQKPKTAESLIDTKEETGGSWQDYAWWWSLCHFLENNPNYTEQFRSMGLGLLMGKKAGYQEVFGPRSKELEFEYLFFLEHLEKGFREDLVAWDWKKKFAPLKGSESASKADVQAGRGWQPSGGTLKKGAEYEYKATGNWEVGKKTKPVSADGNADGAGRLQGAIFKDYKLGEPFDLGASGTFRAADDGDLYLRCKSPWLELPNNSGKISVRVKPKSEKAG